ncbi:FMN-binding negative transcriptional regulator [Mesorhizobium sp. LHD-90]|uniref:FMN-binding negative transcriptional regulator n=1 Tax=Mesorhizobium sp. LHD-90 TaxID=3071414 RepID=UPI0027E086B6|nr:FMN-binding negative transcriptional regulator [Mesorhizobium sp. LHD-90]MDQ6434262.1 FMN-binding negative transcriptional regulator [Mesorhizobium sp. LHD-90]
MYQPPHHREDDLGVQHALIRAHPLGLLITAGADGPTANPLPFHLDAGRGAKGTLQVHMARANGQWKELLAGAAPLVVFQGAENYITPSWYATKRETGKVVPTWNYAMVQVKGKATVIEDFDWLRRQIGALTGDHEGGRAEPWAVRDAPEPFIAAQLKGIVGIEIEVTEIAGKWKVSQNRPAADIAGVVEGLGRSGQPHQNGEMGKLVRDYGAKAVAARG